MSRRHEISSVPENMVWGYIDSTTKPVLEIASGDTVTLHSFPAGGKETLPPDLSIVPADYLAALDQLVQGGGPHFITGPVYVKGAMPGDPGESHSVVGDRAHHVKPRVLLHRIRHRKAEEPSGGHVGEGAVGGKGREGGATLRDESLARGHGCLVHD